MTDKIFINKLLSFIIFSVVLQSYTLISSAQSFSNNENCPKPEHPNPQFYRDNWLNLNGRWGFSFDFDLLGVEKGWHQNSTGFEKEIVVPFCPESELSGIGYTGFMPAVWYHRKFTVPDSWAGTRVFLHFGAVEYDCRAWINGELVGRHHGGNASFEFEITSALKMVKTISLYVLLTIYGRAISHRANRAKKLNHTVFLYPRYRDMADGLA